MMNRIFSLLFLLAVSIPLFAQSSADSVRLTFRAYEPSNSMMFVPGEFNNWGPNSSGVIASNAISKMTTYDTSMGAFLKTYTFKINDPADARRLVHDTIFQYKFNKGGTSNGWYADPLNREQNSNDNSNSVIRLSKLFWFEYKEVLSNNSNFITRITIGLVHANSDTITSIKLSTATTQSHPLTTTEAVASYDEGTRILDTVLTTQISKTNYIRLVAYNNHGDSVVYSKGGYVVPPQMPVPGIVKKGVNLPSVALGDSAAFYVELPTTQQYVLVRVATEGQSLENVIPIVMRKNTSNLGWWIKAKLPAGTYEYVYETESGQLITDPYARHISSNGYPKFTVGPEGLTADNYVWNSTGYVRPPMNKLIMYELNVTEFAGGRYGLGAGQVKWSHMITMLPYLDSLGINCIELMPVTDFAGVGPSGFSWGYDVNSYFALEPSFGTPRDFKEFVDSAHSRGIAVVLDMVFNHLTEASTLWKIIPNEASSPYFKLLSDKRPNEDDLGYFKDIDHWTNETQGLVYSALKMWIDDYHIDGFRYDFTQGIGWNRFDTTKGILGWANKIANEYNNSIYQIAEHLPESPALVKYSGLSGGWHDSFRDEIFDEARFRNVSLTDFENYVVGLAAYSSNDTPSTPTAYANRTEPVNATSNHDEQGILFEMMTFQSVDTATALLRDKLYATFMLTSVGIPMLWEGIEFSAPRGWYTDGERLAFRPVEWYVYPTERGQSHFQYYRTLIMQRKHNPALYQGAWVKQYKYNSEKTMVWGFHDNATGAMLEVVANLSAAPRTVRNVPWLAAGTWYNIFDQSTMIASSTTLDSIVVPAYTALVFSNKSDSELGIPLGVDEKSAEIPSSYSLKQNYPNPFNPSTTFEFSLVNSGYVTIKIYDVLGREVTTLVQEQLHAGTYSKTWKADGLTSGVYFYRLSVASPEGSFTDTKKLVLIR